MSIDDDLVPLAAELRETLAPAIQLGPMLGRGGMGAVFLGRDPALKRSVVIKVLSPDLAHDDVARRRFAREAESAAAVVHPHVVAVHTVGELPRSGTAYFVMQHVDGANLSEVCPEGVKMPAARVRRIIGEVASALAAAHQRGLVHRDIKPPNIMLEKGSERAIVLDFGISAALVRSGGGAADSRLTTQGTSLGTPLYMSPEQAAAEDVTGQSDVYSLGVVAFELLAGRPPFQDTSPMALAAAHIKDLPPDLLALRPDLEPVFAELVGRMLAKSPAARPAAAQIARALLPTAHEVVEWPPPGLDRTKGELAQAEGWVVGSAGAMLAFLFILSLQPVLDTRVFVPLATLTGFAVIVIFLGAALSVAVAMGRVRWARISGYPWDVAFDVSLDHAPDTGELINASGRYAALDAAAGSVLLRRRRIGAVILFAGGALTPLLLFLWGAGILDLSFGSLVPVTVRAIGVMLAPALTGAALWLILTNRERRLRRRFRPGSELSFSLWRNRKRAIPAELVNGWLKGAAMQAPPMRPRWQVNLLGSLVELPTSAGALLVEAVVLSTTVAAIFIPRAPTTSRDAQNRRAWFNGINDDIAHTGGFLSLDSALGVVAGVSPAAAVDTVAARALLMAGTSPMNVNVVWAGFAALPGRLPDSLRMQLASMASADEASRAFSRLAVSGPLPALWYSGGVPKAINDPARLRLLKSLPPQGMRRAAVAVLATASGDRVGAMRAAHEMIAVGRQLLRDPDASASAAGFGMTQSGVRVLRLAAQALDDGRTARLADSLDGRLRQREAMRRRFGAGIGRFFAAPEDTLVLSLAGRRDLAPSDRWAVLAGFSDGLCYNPVELRRGRSPERQRLMAEAGRRASDIAGSVQWAEMHGDPLAGAGSLLEGRQGPFRLSWLSPMLRAGACQWSSSGG